MRLTATGLVILTLTLAGCAVPREPVCRLGLQPMTKAEMFFGRSMPEGKTVTDADWQRFVDEEVSPRFPQGFTIEDGTGQWSSGKDILREGSKRLTIVLPGLKTDAERLEALRRAYLVRFHQEAVLMFETSGCGGFGPPTPDVFPPARPGS